VYRFVIRAVGVDSRISTS